MPMLTAMSSRGQIVLPKKIRTALNLSEGTQFLVFSDNDNILLKPVKMPSVSEFSGVLQLVREWAATADLSEGAIANAVKTVRTTRKKDANRS